MTMVRFARSEMTGNMPSWIHFVREVNGVRPDTFGAPEHDEDTPASGYLTERYPHARVIHAPEGSDEGVRIVAESDEVAAAFREVAAAMKIQIS